MQYSLINYFFGSNFFGLSLGNIAFRSFAAFFTSLIVCALLLRYIINFHTQRMNFQPIRECNFEHQLKNKTPTMGGIAIITATLVASILWAVNNIYIVIIFTVMLIFGVLGFIDDYLKIKHQNVSGIRGKAKILIQVLSSVFSCYLLLNHTNYNYYTYLNFPLLKELTINLGIFYYIFAAIVVIGASNAVNLTDGLDGLSIFPIAVSISCFAFFAYSSGVGEQSIKYSLEYIRDTKEIIVVSAAILGAAASFLWFNCSPAQIFMGDVGSLSLGGVVGIIAVILKREILLVIIGGVFVIEALSVIIQVYYFKFTGGKRFFKMAPIHHHFEKIGWSENKIVIRFWLLSMFFAVLGIMLFLGE